MRSPETQCRSAMFVVMLGLAWCVMTVTHEAGHLVGGWLSGATLQTADLRPWALPYSLHEPDPHPLVTLWAGPLLGVLLPGLIGWLWRHPVARFLADFCCLANGLYLAVAWLTRDHHLDTARLLRAGTSPVWLLLFCGSTIGFGYLGFRRDCIGWFRPKPAGSPVIPAVTPVQGSADRPSPS